MLNKKGVIPVPLLIAGLGVVAVLIILSSADFRSQLFGQLYSKPSSFAVSEPIGIGTTTPGPSPTIIPTPTPDTQPPTVSITNPANGSLVKKSSTVNITANASDNVAVSKVEFYVSGSLICTDTTPSYNCSWNVPKRPRVTYTITAKAHDAAGHSAQASISVTSR